MGTHRDEKMNENESSIIAFPLNLKTNALDAGSIVINSDLSDGTLLMLSVNSQITVNVTDHESYTHAASELAKIKSVAKQIEEKRKDLVKPLDEERKRVMDYVRPFTSALERAEAELKRGLLAYEHEQTRKRELAEAEEAERLRKQQEALARRAEKAEASGHEEKAETLREQAAVAVYVAPPPVAAPPKVSGLSSRRTLSVEVTSLMDLVKAVAEGRAPLKYLTADMKVLNTIAGAMKEDFSVPGVKLVVGASMSARAAK